MSDISKTALESAIRREREANRDWSTAAKRWNEEKSLLESEIAALRERVAKTDYCFVCGAVKQVSPQEQTP